MSEAACDLGTPQLQAPASRRALIDLSQPLHQVRCLAVVGELRIHDGKAAEHVEADDVREGEARAGDPGSLAERRLQVADPEGDATARLGELLGRERAVDRLRPGHAPLLQRNALDARLQLLRIASPYRRTDEE